MHGMTTIDIVEGNADVLVKVGRLNQSSGPYLTVTVRQDGASFFLHLSPEQALQLAQELTAVAQKAQVAA